MQPDVRERLIALARGVTRVTGVTGVTLRDVPQCPPATSPHLGPGCGASEPTVTPVTRVTRVTAMPAVDAAVTRLQRPWASSDTGSSPPDERVVRTHSDLDAGDRQASFEEYAAILEFNGGLSRQEAEQQAFAEAVDGWLADHPAPPREIWRGCAHCLDDDEQRSPLVLVATHSGNTVFDRDCLAAWLASRCEESAGALRFMGVGPSPTALKT